MQKLFGLLLNNSTIKSEWVKLNWLVDEIDVWEHITIWQGITDKTLYKVLFSANKVMYEKVDEQELKGAKNVVTFINNLLTN